MSDMKNRAGCAKIAQPYNKLGMTEPAPPRKLTTDPSTSGGGDQPLGLIELPQRQKVVLVMDLVESVRLMAANERAVIDHWRGFVQHATTDVLPRHRGRMVKSLGDGIMAEFDSARDGTNAALALQRFFDGANATLPHDQQLYLRAGLNATHVYVDDIDIYGSGVNLAARVAGLAGPGEVMVTAEVRDGLTDGLDAVVEDMGECYLKHVAEPVRAYRVGAAGPAPVLEPERGYSVPLQPTVAILPLVALGFTESNPWQVHVFAEELIARVSISPDIRVVSRLSTKDLAGRALSLEEMSGVLGADYVLHGRVAPGQSECRLFVELVEVKSGTVSWSESMRVKTIESWCFDPDLVDQVASAITASIAVRELQRARTQPLPSLSSYSLMLGAVTMMHRTSTRDFEGAFGMLEQLIHRHGKLSRPQAWLANWYALRVTQGHSSQPDNDAKLALRHSSEALDRDPSCSLALAIHGVLLANLQRDMVGAHRQLDAALASNPNESLAWLFKAGVAAFQGSGTDAEAASVRALALSPLDPMKYYYDLFAASASLSARNFSRAIGLAQRSMKANRTHASTYRVLAISQILSGDLVGGRQTVSDLQKLLPGYSVSQFKRQSPYSTGPYGDEFSQALATAGLPLN